MGRSLHENAHIIEDRPAEDFIGRKTRWLRSWRWMVFVVVIVGHCRFALPTRAAATDPRDLQVLTYIQQNYPSWTALWPASLGQDPCTNWTWVGCNEKGRVDRLDLSSKISSRIPPELLEPVYNLFGPIPPELGNLSSLAHLDLSHLKLSGPIPPKLGKLSSLTYLDLSYINLSDSIPPELGNLSSLAYLDLSSTSLSGAIPLELGNLSSLTYLDLSFNNLLGAVPPELGNLSSLLSLRLFSNSLSGPIPQELSNLSSLNILDLSVNSLSGPIPPELGSLSSLTKLDLSRNSLSGPIPQQLVTLSSLVLLHLSSNNLTGAIPPELGTLSNLTTLSLLSNDLSGPIPPELGNLTSLTSLSLSYTSLSGAIPPELGKLSSLASLDLSYTSLSGAIPPEFGKLSSVEYLDLSSNNLSGPIPPELGNLSSLAILDLTSNNLSGPIPPELGKLSSLTELHLSSNNLSGPIPPEFGNLSKAVKSADGRVDVSSNLLVGDVPLEWGNPYDAYLYRLYLNCFNETSGNLYQPGQRDPMACAAVYPELGRNCTPPQVPAAESSVGCVIMVRFVATFICELPDRPALANCDFGIVDTLSQLAKHLSPPHIASCCSLKQVVAVSLNDDGGQTATLTFNVVPLGDAAFSDNVLQGIRSRAKAILRQKNITPGIQVDGGDLAFNHGPLTLVEQPQHFPPPPPTRSPVTYKPSPLPLPSPPLLPPPTPMGSPSSPLGAGGVVGVSVGSLTSVVAVIGLVVWRQWRMRSMGGKREDPHRFHKFTLQELKVATANFAEENRLGRGGFGEVFRGVITDDTRPSGTRVVAIKRAAARGQPGDTGQAQRLAAEQLVQEFKLLDTVYHRCLLRSLGYCIEEDESFFVSEFMPNGSLGDVLKSPATRKLLFWERRRDIVHGTADALNYLHSSCRPPILHNDIKPANVLLDEGWEPHLADFGLAKETGLPVDRRGMQESGGDGSVTVGGVTTGYAAPEILWGGRATTKSDVYSFGCLVLVVLSSKSPSPGINQEVLRLWHEGMAHTVLDQEMDGLDQNEALRFLQVALLCMQQDPSMRLTMEEVCNMLQGLAPVPDPPAWSEQLSLEASCTTLDPMTLDIALRETDIFSAHIPPR